MERPGHFLPVTRTHRLTPTRIASLGFVGVLHVLMIYALATGLATRFIKQLPHELTAQVLPTPQPKSEPPPPVQVQMAQPTLPTVQVPLVKIDTPRPAQTITTIVAPPHPQVTAPVAVTPPAPAPTAASGIARTHTIPPYPDVARRLGQHGTVTLHISISADGEVTDASVANSSGSDYLDSAAVAWVKDHWRYKPATQQGHAIASSVMAAVVFDLKNAG
jgi:protein TonB